MSWHDEKSYRHRERAGTEADERVEPVDLVRDIGDRPLQEQAVERHAAHIVYDAWALLAAPARSRRASPIFSELSLSNFNGESLKTQTAFSGYCLSNTVTADVRTPSAFVST